MITFNKIRYDKEQGQIYCGICGEVFRENTDIYISQKDFGILCEECIGKITNEQIEEFIDLFNKFGGYFGIFKPNQITLKQIVDEFFNLTSFENSADIIESNLKLRYKALLHGYTPKELVRKIKELI